MNIESLSAQVAELRSDLAGYRRQGDFFAIRRAAEELNTAQKTLDRMVQAAPKARAWSDRPEVAVRRMAR